MSGGQRQRVAVARALVKQPALVLADEPTANLDRGTGAELIALMRGMHKHSQTTFIFSSHDPHLIADADDCVDIEDGLLTGRAHAGSLS
jgi:putative ABC transport system ATP-binding protein